MKTFSGRLLWIDELPLTDNVAYRRCIILIGKKGIVVRGNKDGVVVMVGEKETVCHEIIFDSCCFLGPCYGINFLSIN